MLLGLNIAEIHHVNEIDCCNVVTSIHICVPCSVIPSL